jgi:hypothetical protein
MGQSRFKNHIFKKKKIQNNIFFFNFCKFLKTNRFNTNESKIKKSIGERRSEHKSPVQVWAQPIQYTPWNNGPNRIHLLHNICQILIEKRNTYKLFQLFHCAVNTCLHVINEC